MNQNQTTVLIVKNNEIKPKVKIEFILNFITSLLDRKKVSIKILYLS